MQNTTIPANYFCPFGAILNMNYFFFKFRYGSLNDCNAKVSYTQPALSWRASGDRQISLSASAERAFANFRVKNVVFTGTHFCAVLSIVVERAFANFFGKYIVFYKYKFLCKNIVFTSTHFCAFTGGRLCQLVKLGSAGSNRINRLR